MELQSWGISKSRQKRVGERRLTEGDCWAVHFPLEWTKTAFETDQFENSRGVAVSEVGATSVKHRIPWVFEIQKA